MAFLMTKTFRVLLVLLLVLAAVVSFSHPISAYRRNRALIAAIDNKDGRHARKLLELGADPNTPVSESAPSALERVVPGRILDYFLRRNYFPGAASSALELAVENGLDVETIHALLKKGARADVRDGYGGSPLITAADRPNIVRLLIKNGADVNASVSHYGPWTALMGAAKVGNVESCRILLESGADPNIKRSGGESALSLARGKPEIVRLLKGAGAKP